MRDTIIFSGQSNTFGLGLEWELDPILNSDEYLNKGVDLPIDLKKYDEYRENYWKKYRWASLVCNELGYKQYNVHDPENQETMGCGAADTMWHLFDRQNELSIILDRTKYIVLEIGYVRWWDNNFHGKENGEMLPNTPIEIENYLNSKNPDKKVVEAAIKWISEFDEKYFWENTLKKVIQFEEQNPEIKIVFIPWSGNQPGYLAKKEIANTIIKNFLNIGKYHSINHFLKENKLFVNDKAKAFSGKYPILAKYGESHASIEGQRLIANMVIEHIKELEK